MKRDADTSSVRAYRTDAAWGCGLALLWAAFVIGLALGILAGRVTAGPAYTWAPLPSSSFTAVPEPLSLASVGAYVQRSGPIGAEAASKATHRLRGRLGPSPYSGVSVPSSSSAARPVTEPTPSGASVPALVSVGIASWYDNGLGLYAAVPGWHWGDTPYRVRVCQLIVGPRLANVGCVTVMVRDCLCGRSDRIIDLSPAAFARLAPLTVGLLRVSIEVVR